MQNNVELVVVLFATAEAQPVSETGLADSGTVQSDWAATMEPRLD